MSLTCASCSNPPHVSLPPAPCRYTAFIGLYPVGVSSEMNAVYEALPFIKTRGLRSLTLPNPANFAFDYHLFLKVGGWLGGWLAGREWWLGLMGM